MYISNLKDKTLIQENIAKNLEDFQIEICNLDEIVIKNAEWKAVSIKDSNASAISFFKSNLKDCSFNRSNMQEAVFSNSSLSNVEYNGMTLIKASFEKCRISSSKIKQSTMQRAKLKSCIIENTVFKDFEGIYGSIGDCVFKNCSFELTSEQCMNGFADASIKNSIFLDCNFIGYPFRGAKIDSCVFLNCQGEIEIKMSKKDEIQKSIAGMSEETVKDALSLLLSTKKQTENPVSNIQKDFSEKKFSNFAQAINFLKKNYSFQELQSFQTEADLVYVDTGERKVLLTDTQVKPISSQKLSQQPPKTESTTESKNEEETAFEPTKKSGRFGNLEL